MPSDLISAGFKVPGTLPELVTEVCRYVDEHGSLHVSKQIGPHLVVLKIGDGYGGRSAGVSIMSANSWHESPEPGTMDGLAIQTACELFFRLRTPWDIDNLQKAVVSPNGKALAVLALFREIARQESPEQGLKEAKSNRKELT